LHCERVIKHGNTPYITEEISNRWYKMMDIWLETDCNLTNTRYGKKGLKPKIVIQTWKSTLNNEEDLPRNWTGVNRVLVGRSQPWPQGWASPSLATKTDWAPHSVHKCISSWWFGCIFFIYSEVQVPQNP
jgi:hypothetical protein